MTFQARSHECGCPLNLVANSTTLILNKTTKRLAAQEKFMHSITASRTRIIALNAGIRDAQDEISAFTDGDVTF
jgi:hypothetical protein